MKDVHSAFRISFSIIPKVLARALRQEDKIKDTQIGKGETELYLLADSMIVWKIPRDLQKNLLE